MEKRIQLEKRGKNSNQVTELNLDNCRASSIVGFTEDFSALETLSLINVGLTTLKGFPNLPNLKKLELSDNRISNGMNYLETSPKLQSLNLSGNKIKDLDALKPLEDFKNLVILDLFNNEATQVENYREKIFAMLPSLKFLDGFDCNDVEAPSDGDDDDDANGIESDEDESDSDGVVEDEDLEDEAEDGEEQYVNSSGSDIDSSNASSEASLFEQIYNDGEGGEAEDNSDWEEEGGEEEDDYDDIDDDEEGDADGTAEIKADGVKSAEKSAAAEGKDVANDSEESHARGKKRKLDG